MYQSRAEHEEDGALAHRHTRSIIPKPFILWLLAAKSTCAIRRRFVHATRTPFLKKCISCWGGRGLVLSVRKDLKAAKASGWSLTGKNGRSAYISPPMDCSSQRALGCWVTSNFCNLQSLSLPLGILFSQ